MSLENGVSDDVRSGFVLAHTQAEPDTDGNFHKQTFRVHLAGPDWTPESPPSAEELFAVAITKHYEEASNGALRMMLIFAKSLWDLYHHE